MPDITVIKTILQLIKNIGNRLDPGHAVESLNALERQQHSALT